MLHRWKERMDKGLAAATVEEERIDKKRLCTNTEQVLYTITNP